MHKIISLILSFLTALSLSAEGIPYFYRPVIEIDASAPSGEISTIATGYLYGLAESNVPDSNIVESLDISSVSQKVIGGLQHPIGDVDHVAEQLDSCEYIVVYLQDCFDTWYYCHGEIDEMRRNGTYDAMSFMRERFLPQVREKVTELSKKDYADRLVYCLYNECDNAVWFGTPNEDNSWYHFDEKAKAEFYAAWKETYDTVKSIDPDALIGGPGYCDYDSYEISHFLDFCKKNGCLPNVMIYHELGETSSLFWDEHVEDYRLTEKNLGIEKLPVIVTEYGTMAECGVPDDMLKYIVKMEETGVYGNVAYWRLANNLCDTAADNNSPNSNWWLYRWYADMEGQRLQTKIIDVLHSDFANVIKYNRKSFNYKNLSAISSLDGEKLEILCSTADYDADIIIKNLDRTQLKGHNLNVKIECVYFEGLSGIVNKPVTVKEYSAKASSGNMKIDLDSPDPTAVYHIVVTASDEKSETYINGSLPVRYEFERGALLGTAYTYDSAYGTTGEQNGMVGGFEHIGDGVTLDFEIPESGNYSLGIIFGKANDGTKADDRTYTEALLCLDGKEEKILLPNTIKSEYTDRFDVERYFEKGSHTITLSHKNGTFVVDSMLVRPVDTDEKVCLLPDSDRSIDGVTSYLAVAPADGFYTAETIENTAVSVDGANGNTSDGKITVYLRRGLNYIDISSENVSLTVYPCTEKGFSESFSASDMTVRGGTKINKNGFIESIPANGGEASFTVTAPESGSYRVTLTYSNNLEGGFHAYNVDLIESFVTVTANGFEENVWCRNTYSWDTYKTVTFNLNLAQGENTVTLSNNGEYDFNGSVPVTPRISNITVSKAVS
ncbi:MAG: hypothetical protein IKB88_06090 [Clostridia bacterium]|nr:hypothetical protein [Clostridia bacterium]